MNNNVKLLVVLGKLNNAFIKNLSKDLTERNMSASSYPILAHLNQAGKTKVQKLAEVAVITSGTITHMVNKLIKQNYVIKTQDNKDKRIFWIEITDFGRVEFMKVHTEHLKYLDELLSDISEDDKTTFIEQIKYFGKIIENKKEEIK